ncbi:MAG: ABC transporter ATP-binding protein, partial [Candidatus Limnocylindrus sp.]
MERTLEVNPRVTDVDVRLVNVTKKFGEAIAVDAITLDVSDGEFFTLLGPSGCGKTTTLRMIGGFEQPTSGLIELKGADVTFLPAHERDVNTVFQSYALFPHLSIYENVAFGLRRSGVKGDEIKRRVGEAMELVQLVGFEKRMPAQLSGGQAQRVALARALVNEPAVLLLDEPLGALDLKLRKQMGIELKRIQREVGITFIYVTHDQEEAMTMSDRIAVMNKGRYEQLAGPETLYERPATRFVAGFVGASNLLEGKIGSEGDFWTVTLNSGAMVRAPKTLGDIGSSGAIGVRPEKLTLLEPGQESKGNALEGTVVDTSYLGVITQYVVEGKGGLRLLVSEQNRDRTTRNDTWRPGESVTLTWKPESSFVVGDAVG